MEKGPFFYTIRIIFACAAAIFVTSCGRVDPRLEKGAINLELGDYKRARANFEEVLSARPSDYAARLGLGKALLQEFAAHSGDSSLLDDCLTQLEAARTLKPDKEVEKLLSVVWFKRAIALLARYDTLSAMAALSRSIGYDPAASKPVNLAGILYFNRGEREKSLNLFRLVMAIDSCSVNGYFNTGMIYWADSDYARAYEYWYKAALRAPEDKEILTWAAMAKKRSLGLNGIK